VDKTVQTLFSRLRFSEVVTESILHPSFKCPCRFTATFEDTIHGVSSRHRRCIYTANV